MEMYPYSFNGIRETNLINDNVNVIKRLVHDEPQNLELLSAIDPYASLVFCNLLHASQLDKRTLRPSQ